VLSQSDLQRLTAQFDDPRALHGIVLHGSCAKGSDDAASDIDLLCIRRQGRRETKQLRFMERTVDLTLISPSLIRRALGESTPTNNNLTLNALMHGRILTDHEGVVHGLRAEAADIWQKGPAAVFRSERERRLALLQKGLERSRRSAARPASSQASSEIARILVDRVFREAISTYCRLNRHWASDLAQTLEWLRQDDAEFYRRCEDYLLSPDLAQRAKRLACVIEAIPVKV